MLAIPALGWLKQEDHELETSLGYIEELHASLSYIVRTCRKKRKRMSQHLTSSGYQDERGKKSDWYI
jgi:hypothetical protein